MIYISNITHLHIGESIQLTWKTFYVYSIMLYSNRNDLLYYIPNTILSFISSLFWDLFQRFDKDIDSDKNNIIIGGLTLYFCCDIDHTKGILEWKSKKLNFSFKIFLVIKLMICLNKPCHVPETELVRGNSSLFVSGVS